MLSLVIMLTCLGDRSVPAWSYHGRPSSCTLLGRCSFPIEGQTRLPSPCRLLEYCYSVQYVRPSYRSHRAAQAPVRDRGLRIVATPRGVVLSASEHLSDQATLDAVDQRARKAGLPQG